MLLLVTLALVLVAAVSLVLGFAGNHLQPIYLSMVCSLAAAVVLAVHSRLNRRRPSDVTTADAPAPLPADGPDATASGRDKRAEETGELPAATGAQNDRSPSESRGRTQPPAKAERGEHDDGDRHESREHDEGVRQEASEPGAGRGRPSRSSDDAVWADPATIFPIEGYDHLEVAQITAMLVELDDDELQEVRAREEAGRGRGDILGKVDELLGSRGGDGARRPESGDRPAADHRSETADGRSGDGPAADGRSGDGPAADHRSETADGRSGDGPAADHRSETADGRSRDGPAADHRSETADGPTGEGNGSTADRSRQGVAFPIDDYDRLRPSEILPRLAELDPDELDLVATREQSGAHRNAILNRIERLRRTGAASGSPNQPPGR